MAKSTRGGKRGSSGMITPRNMVQPQQQQTVLAGGVVNTPQVAQQAPSLQNTPVVPNAVNNLTQMNDSQLAALVNQSKSVDMPNHLNDGGRWASDATQKFVYAAGVNELPTVMDDASFNQYLKDNNIPRSQILARSTGGANYTVNNTNIRLSAGQTLDMIRYGELNYIGGKHGGNAYGSGTYFDMNGGYNTGYASGATMQAVLNPATARPIKWSTLQSRTQTWRRSHPQAARAIGTFTTDTAAIYALVQGYNVIQSSGTYNNVIDRSAIVINAKNF